MEYGDFVIYLLVFVRLISFLVTSPILMMKGIPNIIKVGLGLIISLLIYNFVSYAPGSLPSSVTALMGAAAGECLFGIFLGFMTTMFLYAIMMSGQLMDLQIGFSMASEYNPISSGNVSVLGNLTHLTGLVVFFLVDGHQIGRASCRERV